MSIAILDVGHNSNKECQSNSDCRHSGCEDDGDGDTECIKHD